MYSLFVSYSFSHSGMGFGFGNVTLNFKLQPKLNSKTIEDIRLTIFNSLNSPTTSHLTITLINIIVLEND